MIYVLYHAACVDGFGAAMAAYKKFGDQATYIAVSHGNPIPVLENPSEVYILDFSYPKDVLIELSKKCKVVVLDHHVSAQKDLEGLDFAKFDMKKSGATMAWEYFNGGYVPDLVKYIEDRDIWNNKLEKTKEVSISISTYPMTFESYEKLLETPISELAKTGEDLLRFKNMLILDTIKNSRKFSFLGHNIVVVNGSSYLASDLGHAILDNNPDIDFSGVYYDMADGKRKWSFRSEDHRIDVSIICKQLGGGGHRNAAGFIENYPGEKVKL